MLSAPTRKIILEQRGLIIVNHSPALRFSSTMGKNCFWMDIYLSMQPTITIYWLEWLKKCKKAIFLAWKCLDKVGFFKKQKSARLIRSLPPAQLKILRMNVPDFCFLKKYGFMRNEFLISLKSSQISMKTLEKRLLSTRDPTGDGCIKNL